MFLVFFGVGGAGRAEEELAWRRSLRGLETEATSRGAAETTTMVMTQPSKLDEIVLLLMLFVHLVNTELCTCFQFSNCATYICYVQ